MRINTRKIIDYLVVYLGCIIQAFAVTAILRPNNLIVGGFTGISIVLGQLINIKYTYIYYTLCVSIIFTAWIFLGKKQAMNIILLSTTYPLILIIFDSLNMKFIDAGNDKLLACIYYGIIMGIGSGLVLRKGFSQGGSDTIAKIINKNLFPFISISQILLAIDIIILTVSSFVFGRNAVLYALVMQMIYAKTIDTVIFGFGSPLVKMTIVSIKTDEIVNYILNTINRGASVIEINGTYTSTKRVKIVTVCSSRESMLIKDFIAKNDSSAFINVVPVISAWGNGNGFDQLIVE